MNAAGGKDRRRGLGPALRSVPVEFPNFASSGQVAGKDASDGQHRGPLASNGISRRHPPDTAALRGGGVRHSSYQFKSTSSLASNLPVAPQSSQIHLGNGHVRLPSHLPPIKTMGSPTSPSSSSMAMPVMSELLPSQRSNKAFRSTTYLREVTLPASQFLPATATTLKPVGIRQVNMAKSRYLPVPTVHRNRHDPNAGFGDGLLMISPLGTGHGPADRLHATQQDLEKTRWLKRSSEYLPHRVPLGYAMAGNQVSLHQRLDFTSEADRLMLQEMQQSNRLYYGEGIKGSTRPSKMVQKMKTRRAGEAEPSASTPTEPVADGAGDPRPASIPTPVRSSPTPSSNSRQGGRVAVHPPDANSGGEKDKKEDDDDDWDKNSEESSVFAADAKSVASSSNSGSLAPRRARLRLASKGNRTGILQDMSKLVRKESLGDGEDFMTYMESYVSDEHRRIFTESFNEIDRKKSGVIRIQALQKGMFGDTDDAQYVMEVFDLNQDGTIDLEEFIAVAALNDRLSGMLNGQSGKDDPLVLNLPVLAHHIGKFKTLFKLADDSGDGRVETGEILVLLAAAFGLPALDKTLAETVMNVIDADKSGFIEFVEFMQYIPFFLKVQRKIVKDPLALDMVENAKKGMMRRKSQKKIVKVEKTNKKLVEWNEDANL